jgi:hypothetical protein
MLAMAIYSEVVMSKRPECMYALRHSQLTASTKAKQNLDLTLVGGKLMNNCGAVSAYFDLCWQVFVIHTSFPTFSYSALGGLEAPLYYKLHSEIYYSCVS